MIFNQKISKGHNSTKIVGVVTFLFSAPHLMVYICTNFHENILDGIKVIELTWFSKKNSKGHNSVKNVGGVTALLCTSSYGC